MPTTISTVGISGAALLTEWDIKSTHSTSGWANHTISFSAKAAVRGIRIHNNYIFSPGTGGGPLQHSTINTMHWLDSPRVNIITLQLNSLIAEVRISSSLGALAETREERYSRCTCCKVCDRPATDVNTNSVFFLYHIQLFFSFSITKLTTTHV